MRFPHIHLRGTVLALLAALLAPAVVAAQPHYTVVYSARAVSQSNDKDLFGPGFGSDGLLDKSADQPSTISALASREMAPAAVSIPDGGYIVAYTVEHTDSAHMGDRDIVMRRISREGNNVWGDSANPFVVVARSKFIETNPRLAILEDGSIIVCYEIHYGPSRAGDIDIVATRFSADGAMLWEKGAWVANSSKRLEILKGLTSDGTGGAIALIEARQYTGDSLTASDILAQRIDTSSMMGWKDSREPVTVAASPYLEMNPAMTPDGDGGIYVAYQIDYNKGNRAGDADILAQRLTRWGARAWTDERNLPIVSSNAKARERNPAISRDSNGIVVAFEMSFAPSKGKGATAHVLGMQRLDTLGQPTWNLGRKSKLISVARSIVNRPQLLPDIGGGVYVVFQAVDTATNNHDIYGQRVGPMGDQMWGDGERPTPIFNSAEDEVDATAMNDHLGGLVVVAVRYSPAAEPDAPRAIVAQRLNPDGDSVWVDLNPALPVVSNAYNTSAPILVRQ